MNPLGILRFLGCVYIRLISREGKQDKFYVEKTKNTKEAKSKRMYFSKTFSSELRR